MIELGFALTWRLRLKPSSFGGLDNYFIVLYYFSER